VITNLSLLCGRDADTLVYLLLNMAHLAEDDPFKDPSLINQASQAADVPDTLTVGKNASLTLGTDCLVVLGTYREYCGLHNF
jgi:hypothetical protein